MPLVGSSWSSTLQGILAGKGFTGSRLSDFTDAIGNGSVNYLIGKGFTTSDVGTTPGAGAGIGTGISGFSVGSISSNIYAKAVSYFGTSGSKLLDICDSLETTFISEMANATLTSTHAPVYLGSGVVDIGSIAVVGSAWGSSIESEGSGSGFIGNKWPDFALAIGEGQAEETVNQGTGTVTITGGGTPPPVPGTGTGSGVLS